MAGCGASAAACNHPQFLWITLWAISSETLICPAMAANKLGCCGFEQQISVINQMLASMLRIREGAVAARSVRVFMVDILTADRSCV